MGLAGAALLCVAAPPLGLAYFLIHLDYDLRYYVVTDRSARVREGAWTVHELTLSYAKGIGGTRNLDFWFADEAAIVDTAGRYTSQDSDASADSAGWRSLLEQLKRNRPKQPINGVIVALGVDELLKTDLAGIDRHATAVRRRLVELHGGRLEIASAPGVSPAASWAEPSDSERRW